MPHIARTALSAAALSVVVAIMPSPAVMALDKRLSMVDDLARCSTMYLEASKVAAHHGYIEFAQGFLDVARGWNFSAQTIAAETLPDHWQRFVDETYKRVEPTARMISKYKNDPDMMNYVLNQHCAEHRTVVHGIVQQFRIDSAKRD